MRLGNYSWVFKIKPDSSLSTRDMMVIFDYSSPTSICSAVKDGRLPKPDFTTYGHNRAMKNNWYVSTIQQEIQRRLAGELPKPVVGKGVPGEDDPHPDVSPQKLLDGDRSVDQTDEDDQPSTHTGLPLK